MSATFNPDEAGSSKQTVKILAAGFEPTPRETDFESVVVTTWLRPVRWTFENIIHEWMARCVPIEKLCRGQLSNLLNPIETDFNSVVVTTWIRTVRWTSEGTIHEWISRCILREKAYLGQVSNLLNAWETDFNSVVVTTCLRPTWLTSEETIHERMSRCVPIDKKLSSVGFEPAQPKRNRFWLC